MHHYLTPPTVFRYILIPIPSSDKKYSMIETDADKKTRTSERKWLNNARAEDDWQFDSFFN